jgi:GT2 family glycosyltransferase
LAAAVPNQLIISQQPHHQILEILAAKALAGQDFANAFKFADRRCRIDPSPLAHSYVLRAEAAHNIGDKSAALADLTSALNISAHDAAATRRMFTWATGSERYSTALNLIAHDQDVTILRAAIKALASVSEGRLASISVFDEYVAGWAAWDRDAVAELTIVSENNEITCLLVPDPFHPLSSHSVRATAFYFARPSSAIPQMLSISLRGEVFFSWRMAPNSSNKTVGSAVLHPRRLFADDPRPTVIVPVYGDYSATTACLESLLTDTQAGKSYRILIVDDASPEPELSDYVNAFSKHPNVSVLTNPINLGFVGSINRALSHLRGGDIVLLNADTIVPPGFVDRLQAAAQVSDNIGTVVPLSNNGGISDFPYPNRNNTLGSWEDVVLLDRIAATYNHNVVVDTPNGTGFCLYVTRACLDAVGGLSENFQRGYLEDIDFCLRARESGFRNVCAPSVYVGHAGSRSFKSEKRSLVLRNLGVLDRRFPHFRAECAAFVASDPLRPAREAIERQLPPPTTLPALILTGTGAPRAVAQRRANRLRAEGRAPILLDLIYQSGQLRISFSATDESAPQSLSFGLTTPDGLRDLRAYLKALAPSHCEIVDPAMTPTSFTETLAALSIPFDVWIIDGDSIASALDSQDRALAASVTAADSWCSETMSAARNILVPCPTAEVFTKRILKGRKPVLFELPVFPLSLLRRRSRGAKTLAIVPARSSAKAFLIIRALAVLLDDWNSDVAIIVAGSTFDDVRLMSHDNVFVTGPVEASELGNVLQAHNVSWMFTGFDGPLFGHPLIQSTMNADIPVAYLDWSMGCITPRPGDLAIRADAPSEQLCHQMVLWIERG